MLIKRGPFASGTKSEADPARILFEKMLTTSSPGDERSTQQKTSKKRDKVLHGPLLKKRLKTMKPRKT